MPGIGLHVVSAPRDGVALLKFLVDIAKGDGGKIVEELLAAETKLTKMEADANVRLDEREAKVVANESASDVLVRDHLAQIKKASESFEAQIAQGRKELEEAVRAEQAKLARADQALEEKRLVLVNRVMEVEAAAMEAKDLMSKAEKLNTSALALARRYEAWAAQVDTLKV